MAMYITHSHVEDPLDHFNWKNVSITYQRDWMQYVHKLLEVILETNKVMNLYLLCVNRENNFRTVLLSTNCEGSEIKNPCVTLI